MFICRAQVVRSHIWAPSAADVAEPRDAGTSRVAQTGRLAARRPMLCPSCGRYQDHPFVSLPLE